MYTVWVVYVPVSILHLLFALWISGLVLRLNILWWVLLGVNVVLRRDRVDFSIASISSSCDQNLLILLLTSFFHAGLEYDMEIIVEMSGSWYLLRIFLVGTIQLCEPSSLRAYCLMMISLHGLGEFTRWCRKTSLLLSIIASRGSIPDRICRLGMAVLWGKLSILLMNFLCCISRAVMSTLDKLIDSRPYISLGRTYMLYRWMDTAGGKAYATDKPTPISAYSVSRAVDSLASTAGWTDFGACFMQDLWTPTCVKSSATVTWEPFRTQGLFASKNFCSSLDVEKDVITDFSGWMQ